MSARRARWTRVAALAAVLALGGCGGGGDGGKDPANGATAPGAGTEARNTAPPARLTDRRLRRAAFSVPLPEGYRDTTHSGALEGAAVKPELLLSGEQAGGVVTNVNVVRVKVPKVTLTALLDAERRQRAALGARFRGANRKLDLDGEPAASFAFQAPPTQGDYIQRQVFALRGGREVVVTLTASSRAFDAGERVLEALVDGWRWR